MGQTVTSRARHKSGTGSLQEGDEHNGTGKRLPEHPNAADVWDIFRPGAVQYSPLAQHYFSAKEFLGLLLVYTI